MWHKTNCVEPAQCNKPHKGDKTKQNVQTQYDTKRAKLKQNTRGQYSQTYTLLIISFTYRLLFYNVSHAHKFFQQYFPLTSIHTSRRRVLPIYERPPHVRRNSFGVSNKIHATFLLAEPPPQPLGGVDNGPEASSSKALMVISVAPSAVSLFDIPELGPGGEFS
jgi:hypothetical protein